MQEALAAQKADRLDDARGLYELVLARAPMTGDAIHMLGTVFLQSGDLDAAEPLLARAQELMPDAEIVSRNLTLLRHRRTEQSGLHVAATISAVDTLRILNRRRALPDVESPAAFLSADVVGPVHIVIPGDSTNAASNQSGITFWRSLSTRTDAFLWTDHPRATALPCVCVPHRVLTEEDHPQGGTLALFGAGMQTLKWLPHISNHFATIAIAVDAHDPALFVDLFDVLGADGLERLRLVARTPLILREYGLPGAIDDQVFESPPAERFDSSTSARRMGVFIPAEKNATDKDRWNLLEWLRTQGTFVRLLYPGALPSRHIANESEHLLGLATDWDTWIDGLDSLFYWGIEGRTRQFDRLVFEAMRAGLKIVADGYGDYAHTIAERGSGTMFFGADQGRSSALRTFFT